MVTLSDEQIRELLSEPKPIPSGLVPTPQMSIRNRSYRRDIEFCNDAGHSFVIKLRQSSMNIFDFSVILGYRVPGISRIFHLRRYNGNSHPHTNHIENQRFRAFHKHTATERYQLLGAREEHFAEVDNRFSNIDGAIFCLLSDCGFRSPLEQSPLWKGEVL